MSVDLSKWLRPGKKGGATGIQTHDLWLSMPVLCRWATTPTGNHPQFCPHVRDCSWCGVGYAKGCCVGEWWSSQWAISQQWTPTVSTPKSEDCSCTIEGWGWLPVPLRVEGRLPVRVVAQRQSTGTESQTPWVWIPVAPPFFPALSHFQRSTDIMVQLVSLQT